MTLQEAKNYYKKIAKNQDKIEVIPVDKFIDFAICMFKEMEEKK